MKIMQEDILKWTEDLKSDPNVALFNKFNSTKESLKEKYKTYQELLKEGDLQ